MSRAPRRLTMQLTPLLDLLLIVIFAQYMEVTDTEAARAALIEDRNAALQQSEAALRASETESLELRQALDEAFRLIAEARRAMQSSQELIRRNREELQLQEQAFEESQERLQILGKLLVELFRIPQTVIDDILDPHRVPPLTESSEEFARLRAEFRRMAEADPGDVVKHLLTFDEVRKRCDFWELHLQASPRRLRLLDAHRNLHELTIPLRDERPGAALDRIAFERDLYALLKTWPQPKSLVVLILTYDADVRINIRDPAEDGIRAVLDRLRGESAGRTRFEFADFGIPVP